MARPKPSPPPKSAVDGSIDAAMARPKPSPPPKSPFFAPRRTSSYGGGSELDATPPPIKGADASESHTHHQVAPEHKSNLIGCTANLITAIVGAGIIGIPFALRETGLVAGILLILLSGVLGCKSLLLLVETAKHVDAASYEILCETVFGQIGWVVCNVMMFLMSWGPMLSYLMLVKDTLGQLTGYPESNCLILSSLFVMLPIALQRDMADLAKTSRISVLFNIGLVFIIARYSPTTDSIEEAGGLAEIISQSTFRPSTCFIGLGIISFAFSCQHSSLIIAGSLANPTRERWSKVSIGALTFCSVLSIIMGAYGYVGFLDKTDGNILRNFPLPSETMSPEELVSAKAANVGRLFVCGTMLFVYPLESFVARHVIMTNLFQGREAHEGDDHAVLDRWDRRVVTTIVLYLSALIPALHFENVGIVLSWTGAVAASTLTYIGPGLLFIGVHGQEFLDLVEGKWCDSPGSKLLWYLLLMPFWTQIAKWGKRGLSIYKAKKELMTPADVYRLGKVKHKHDLIRHHKQQRSRDNILTEDECEATGESDVDSKTSLELGLITASKSTESYGSLLPNQSGVMEAEEGEDDPQDELQSTSDFAVAIFFVAFGVLAFSAGVFSIMA